MLRCTDSCILESKETIMMEWSDCLNNTGYRITANDSCIKLMSSGWVKASLLEKINKKKDIESWFKDFKWQWIHCIPREVAPMINLSVWLVKISTSFLVWICLASTFRYNYLFNAKLKSLVLRHVLIFIYAYEHRASQLVFSVEKLPEWEINYTIEILAETTNCCSSLYVPDVSWHMGWTFSIDTCLQKWRWNTFLKTASHFVPVIDCQCRDEDLIRSQTTIIIPSKFKFTFAEFMFALSSTCFVPKRTGGIKIQVRMPHS